MSTFERRAVEIKQGELTLYLTHLTPRDLFNDNFYNVDKLEPMTQDGYQRILNDQRANRLARHLKESFPAGYANIPTTILLATDKPIGYNQNTGSIRFERDDVCPFNVVDGQHRIEGLKRAIDNDINSQLWDFELPATIAVNLDDIHQMYHFYIVNTTQKPVQTDLSQQITRRFTDMQDFEKLPYLPFWLSREVHRGTDAKALKLAEFLNTDDDSPLKERIKMANDTSKLGNRINQGYLVSIFKQTIFIDTNPITHEDDIERQLKMMLNYLRSVDKIFVRDIEPDNTIVWRTAGLYFFCLISKWIFTDIYASTKDFTVDSISKVFQSALDELDDDYQDIAHREWWQRGRSGGASGMNRVIAGFYASGFLDALRKSQSVEIKI